MFSHAHYRRYVLMFAVAFCTLLAALSGFNYIVDPLNYFSAPKSTGIDAYKPFGSQRIHKLAQVKRGNWTVVIVGSSRAAVGLKPEHPHLPAGQSFNAGLNGAEITEIVATARYAIDHNDLEVLILLLDPAYFNPNSKPAAVFASGPHHPDYAPSTTLARMLLGMETTTQSFEAISTYRHRMPPEMNQLGHRVTPIGNAATGHHAMFVKLLADLAAEHDGAYDASKIAPLEALLVYAVGRGVRVDIAIAPSHVSRLVQIDRMGTWDHYCQFKRDLVASVSLINDKYEGGPAIRLIDFAVIDEHTTGLVPSANDLATAMPWFWEPVHFKSALGDIVLDQLLGADEASVDFGVDLLQIDIEEHLQHQHELLQVYAAFHAVELRELGIAER